jgi:hypothetical protein
MNETELFNSATALVESGLVDAGYTTLTLDWYWYVVVALSLEAVLARGSRLEV